MRLLKEERGISLLEVVASVVLIMIILLSFFSFFVQSKKTHVASESIVEATYIAQQDMEEIYGLISVNNESWLNNNEITLQGQKFIYNATGSDCIDCKKFFSSDNPEHWIELKKNINHPKKLVNVVVNVPKKDNNSSIKMESIFRWGNY